MAKQAEKQREASPVVATTYLGHRKDGKWRMVRVRLHEDGALSSEEVAAHAERRIIHERLRVALLSGEVLP